MLLVVLLCSLLLASSEACSCFPRTLQTELCTADRLIRAEVLEEIDQGINFDDWRNQASSRQFRINILDVFRGNDLEEGELIVETAANGALCGVQLPVGSVMLLEVDYYRGVYSLNLCDVIRMWNYEVDDEIMSDLMEGTLDCECQPANRYADSPCCDDYTDYWSVGRCTNEWGRCSAQENGDCGWERSDDFETCLNQYGFTLNEDRCVSKKPCPEHAEYRKSWIEQVTCDERSVNLLVYPRDICVCPDDRPFLDTKSDRCVAGVDCPREVVAVAENMSEDEETPGDLMMAMMEQSTECPSNQIYFVDECLPCLQTCGSDTAWCTRLCVTHSCGCPKDKPVMELGTCYSQEECAFVKDMLLEEAEEEAEEEGAEEEEAEEGTTAIPTAAVEEAATTVPPSTQSADQSTPPPTTDGQSSPPTGESSPPTSASGQSSPPTDASVESSPPTTLIGESSPPTTSSGESSPPTGESSPPTEASGQSSPPTDASDESSPPTESVVSSTSMEEAGNLEEMPPCVLEEMQLLKDVEAGMEAEVLYCDEDGNYLPKICRDYENCMCVDREGFPVDGMMFSLGMFECDFDTGYICPDGRVFNSCAAPDRYCGLLEHPYEECEARCACPEDAPFLDVGDICVAEEDCAPIPPFELLINQTFHAYGLSMTTVGVDEETCVDNNPTCTDWARRDLCENPYLQRNCWKSCNLCPETEIKMTCEDVRESLASEQEKTGALGVPAVECLAEDETKYFPRQCIGSVCYCVNDAGEADLALTHGRGHLYTCPGSPECPQGQFYSSCRMMESCDEESDMMECEQGCGCPYHTPVWDEENMMCISRQDCPIEAEIDIRAGEPCNEALERNVINWLPACERDQEGQFTGEYSTVQCSVNGECYCVSASGEVEEIMVGVDYICQRERDSCRGGAVFQQCRNNCPTDCENFLEFNRVCTLQCERGCSCPSGTVEHEGECITYGECPNFEEMLPINCAERLQIFEKLMMDRVPGAPIPECDEDGNYSRTQRVGSEAYCVDPETGAEIAGTRRDAWEDYECGCEGGKVWNSCGTACPKTCDNMNEMRPCTLQCVPECQCPSGTVDNDGECVAPSECPTEEDLPVRCEDRASNSLDQLPGAFVPNCDAMGDYEYRQCHGSVCYCVDPSTGEEVENTEHSIAEYEYDCEQAYMTANRAHTCHGDLVWNQCGMSCNITCEDPTPICNRKCTPRCQCPDPEMPVNADGRCHSLAECPTMMVPTSTAMEGPGNLEVEGEECGGNATWNSCGSQCDLPTCENRMPDCHNLIMAHDDTVININFGEYDCNPRCECNEGFLHNMDGVCVPIESCPREKTACEREEMEGGQVKCAEDGTYAPTQCRNNQDCNERYCVTEEGEMLRDSEHSPEEFEGMQYCDYRRGMARGGPCASARRDAEEYAYGGEYPMLGAFIPECTADGLYDVVQCQGSVCYCVDEYGVEHSDVEFHIGNRAEAMERCAELRLSREQNSACLTDRREADRNSNRMLIGGFQPNCTDEGEYAPTQCVGSVCYCAHHVTGEELSDSSFSIAFLADMEGMCQEKVMMMKMRNCSLELEKYNSAEMLLGAFKPNCTTDGFYHARQCLGSMCYCVEPELGRQLPDTSHFIGADGDCENKLQIIMSTQCNQARKLSQDGTSIGGFVPMCEIDGSYSATQCHGSMCYCAHHITGEKLSNSSFDVGSYTEMEGMCQEKVMMMKMRNCSLELEIYNAAEMLLGAFKPNCTTDGFYHARQCLGSMCYCVEPELGRQLPDTSHSIGADGDCENKLQIIMSTQCNQARKLSQDGTSIGGFVPMCEIDGSYSATQCLGSMCYCADREGNELANSQHDIADMNDMCDERRVLMESSKCYMEKQAAANLLGAYSPNCDEEGGYEAIQCKGSSCFCVDEQGNQLIEAPMGQEGSDYCEELRVIHANSACYQAQAAAGEGGMVGVIVHCNPADGKYLPEQCTGSQCYCVDVHTGENIQGTEHPIHDLGKCGTTDMPFVRCDEQKMEDVMPGAPIMICDEEGMYFVQQCVGTECRCVDKFGMDVDNATTHHISEQVCLESAERLLGSANEGCEGARALANAYNGIGGFVPSCQDDGTFHYRQCAGSVCFCVNPADGTPLEDSREHPISTPFRCEPPLLHIRAPTRTAVGEGSSVTCAIAADALDDTFQMYINNIPVSMLEEGSAWSLGGFERNSYVYQNGTVETAIEGFIDEFTLEQNNSEIRCSSERYADASISVTLVLNSTMATGEEEGSSFIKIYNSKRGYLVALEDGSAGLAETNEDVAAVFEYMEDNTIRSIKYPDWYLTQNLADGQIVIQFKSYKGNSMQTWYRNKDEDGDDRLYVLRPSKKGQTEYYLDYFKRKLGGYKATGKSNQKWKFV